MKYVSTRGQAPVLGFGDVLLAGLATDGGLYVPEAWPALAVDDLATWADRSYQDIAVDVMAPFVEGDLEPDELAQLVARAYAGFDHADVTPLRDLGAGLWLLELFHGPTLAFKDVALQLVGPLFERELARREERITIIGATSGDTGSAAIEATKDREGIEIVMLHPHGRVSEIQRLQMTTVASANVHNLAVDGTFDDCQDLVKAMFADEALREDLHLSAVNSMNWARLMAQVVYYVYAASRLLGPATPALSFSVPSGNFGNIFSGWVARRMGVPIAQLLCASNRNDILTRFFATGVLELGEVVPTISPSMDIQVSSNLERLLFELHGRDAAATTELLHTFRSEGRAQLAETRLAEVDEVFDAGAVDDDRTLGAIADWRDRAGILVDPHTAVGLVVGEAQRRSPDLPLVCLATAHPAKFADAVEAATGTTVALPPRLAALSGMAERYEVVPNDLVAVRARVRALTS
ncbi:MAG: threonine synthase [Acidimicrobiales bacterium]